MHKREREPEKERTQRTKERASQRKNDPNANQRANQMPISEQTKRRSAPNQTPIQTPISSRTKRRSSHEPNTDPPLRTKHRFRPTPVTSSSPHRRSFTVVRSPSFRKTHGEFSFHLWPIRPPIHTSPHCQSTVTEPHLHKTHKSDPHTSWIRCAFYIYIYIYIHITPQR